MRTAFTELFDRLRRVCPQILAILLIDEEGESVETWGVSSEFDQKILGAQMRMFVSRLPEYSAGSRQVNVITDRCQIWMFPLDTNYVFVVKASLGYFKPSHVAQLYQTKRNIAEEAGIALTPVGDSKPECSRIR